MEVLKEVDKGRSVRSIAEQFGVGKTQVSDIRTKRKATEDAWESGESSKKKQLKKRKCPYNEVNDACYDWFKGARSKDIPVSGALLREQVNDPSLN